MIRRPPRSTRTDTLFPYSTLFRSGCVTVVGLDPRVTRGEDATASRLLPLSLPGLSRQSISPPARTLANGAMDPRVEPEGDGGEMAMDGAKPADSTRTRSEGRRVGNEGVSTCRSRWSRYH